MNQSAQESTSIDEKEQESSSTERQGTDGDSGYDTAEKEPGSDRGRGASEDDMVERVESEGFDIDRVDIDDHDHTEDEEDDIEEERKRRLDPENRPENAEVDNTQRTFDTEKGVFEDSPEEARIDGEPTFPSVEGESSSDDEGSGDSDDEADTDGAEEDTGDDSDRA